MKIQLSKYPKEYSLENRKTKLNYENESVKIYTINLIIFSRFLVVTINKKTI